MLTINSAIIFLAYENGINRLLSNFMIKYRTTILLTVVIKLISFDKSDMLAKIRPMPYKLNIPTITVTMNVVILKTWIFCVKLLEISNTIVIKKREITDCKKSLTNIILLMPYGETMSCSMVPIFASFTIMLLTCEKDDS